MSIHLHHQGLRQHSEITGQTTVLVYTKGVLELFTNREFLIAFSVSVAATVMGLMIAGVVNWFGTGRMF